MDDEEQRRWHGIREILGSKWSINVVASLADADRGFNELRRKLGGVTAKTLSTRLKELRCLGFVEKEVHPTTPPTTTYRLTTHGDRLAAILADVDAMVDVMDCPVDEDCPVEHCVVPTEPAGPPACDC